MNKSRSIPKELIKVKAHKIWKKRLREGKDGTPEDDWIKAKKYLEKHGGKVFLWKLGKTLNKLWKLIARKVRASIRTLWRFLTFPFWFFRTLHSLFVDSQSRSFALDIVKTFISTFSLIATIFAGVGLFLNYQDAKEDRKLTQKQLDTAQERLVTERFSKAVEQLVKDKDTTVRIGGIYALERIAKDSSKDHWTIMEILTSYVRENSSLPPQLKQYPKDKQEIEQRQKELAKLTEVNIDVQAVLTVIGRREDPEPNRDEKIDLSLTNLQKGNLFKANLQNADLRGANLQKGNLRGANLQEAVLWEVNLQEVYLERANLQEAHLIGANLQEANLKGANLQEAYLIGANLQKGNLIEANLQEANLRGANLQEAVLRRVNLQEAILRRANLQEASLFRANLQEVVLWEAKNLTSQQIKSACNWENAIYIGEWNNEKQLLESIEPDNTNFIDELKKDKASDPKKPPDCSIWDSEN